MASSDENQSHKSNESFPEVFQTAPFAIFEVNYNPPRLMSVNQAMCQLTGYTEQELLSMNPIEILDKESAERFRDRLKQGLAGQMIDSAVEFKVKAKSGRDIWAMFQVKPTYKKGKLDSALVVGFDITERKKAEEALVLANKKFQSLFNNHTVGIAYCQTIFNDQNQAVDYTVLDINPTYEKQVGIKREMIVGKRITEAFPDVSQDLIDKHNVVAVTGQDSHFEIYEPTIDRWFDVNVFSPQIGYFIALFYNITNRKKADEAIRRQAQVIELSPDGTIVRKVDGTITFWGKGAEGLYGYTKEEALGKNSHDLLKTLFPRTLGFVNSEFQRAREWTGELIQTTKYGQSIIVRSSWIVDNLEVLEINVDITELKTKERALKDRTEQLERTQTKLEENAVIIEEYANRMEELAKHRTNQLKDAERLAAIGATAGMVGHDIRNPLQSIISDVYLAKSELSSLPDSDGKKNTIESLDEVEKNIFYINKIISDLQDYARPVVPTAKEVSLESTINEALRNQQIPLNIKTVINVQKEADTLTVDPDLLKRILSNLIVNAVQAMPEEGTLAIRAYQDVSSVVIRVQDTGKGIPEEVKPKLFTPLFTTKSKGQGFGLAVIKRLTEALGGTVTFESESGNGTIFIIRLPIAQKS